MPTALKKILKIAISFILILYLVSIIDKDKILPLFQQVQLFTFALVVLSLWMGVMIGAVRWKILLGYMKIEIPWKFSLRLKWTAIFYNMILPGSTGGDVYRSIKVSQSSKESLPHLMASVMLERMTGVVAIIVLGAIATLVMPTEHVQKFNAYWIHGLRWLAFGLVVSAILFFLFFQSRIQKKSKQWDVVTTWKKKIVGVMLSVFNLPWQGITKALLISFGKQFFEILAPWIISMALGLSLSIDYFFIIIPYVFLAIMMPISFGGVGVREGMFVFILGELGVDSEQAIFISLTVYFSWMIIALLGGIVNFLLGLKDDPTAQDA